MREEMVPVCGSCKGSACLALWGLGDPYGDWETLEKAARQVKDMDGDLVILDCIGFTQEMKNMFARETGKLVVLPRTLLARVISELTDVE